VANHPITVLVIDDETHMRRLIGRMLQKAGFRVLEAGTGKQTFALLSQPENRPDVITCDISMPDMDGFEILEKIKADPELAGIPVIMLTAMGQVGDANRAKELGATDYITKPFSAIRFIEILRHHVKNLP